MKQIRDSYKKAKRLHHAYGISGDRENILRELSTFLEEDLGFPLAGNPDFWQAEFGVFKIGDSRKLKEAHLNKPVKYQQKIFIISANFITKDAQNSLLKIFEEPSGETVFFLIFPSLKNLLPTLLSRIMIIDGSESAESNEEASKFITASPSRRLEKVAKILNDIKAEKISKAEAILFVKDIERAMVAGKKSDLSAIETVEKALNYLNDEAPSVKVVLEHLALAL